MCYLKMNTILELLEEFDFERTSFPFSSPLVIHAVPGSGKTSLLREALLLDPTISVCTFGEPDKTNLEGRYIQPAIGCSPSEEEFYVLDEYLSGNWKGNWKVLLSDPFQNSGHCLAAHFVKRVTKRFGKSTCKLLKELGWSVESDKEDEVTFEELIGSTPSGLTICLEKDVEGYLKGHNCPFKKPCQVRGLTEELVSVVVSRDLKDLFSPELFVALTRHTRKLRILMLNVANRSTGLQ
ncbi:triple gene block protein 1 [Rubus virus 1]|uniref:Triple gene block protein 1 n=1 Tax=Rubus virus 1 TaxID=2754817 RepID=A0AAE7G3W8_9VIRU|nr:triple gene block protein 1 [Rubus virus 1]QLI58026.1 triple gene block protein 1 [Rubus virus 1]